MKKNKLILFDWGGIVESFTTGYSCRKAWNHAAKCQQPAVEGRHPDWPP